MTIQKFVAVRVGDQVRLRKPHPCGGFDWAVVRVGADIGLKCHTCAHRVMIERPQFERRLKTFLARAEPGPDEGAQAG